MLLDPLPPTLVHAVIHAVHGRVWEHDQNGGDKTMSDFDRELFEEAFSANFSSCRRKCICGREFYDAVNSGYTWEDGELEALQNDPKATALPYSVSMLNIEGVQVVADCDCWIERAKKIADWLGANDHQITKWLNRRKAKAMAEAKHMPEVKP